MIDFRSAVGNVQDVLEFLSFFLSFLSFYCYSITVVCLFSPSLHPSTETITDYSDNVKTITDQLEETLSL